MIFAHRLLLKHRIESHQLININRLELQFCGNPFDSLLRNVTKVLLNSVQQHQRRAALFRVMRDKLIDFCLQRSWDSEIRLGQQLAGNSLGWMNLVHRSHSPMTKSIEPRMATTSLTMCPGKSRGKMLRFTNEGARIFSRWGVPPPLL